MKLIQHIININLFFLLIAVGFGQSPGCMDNGYQDWSPNYGIPACNYDLNANEDDGSCLYLNCEGVCKEILVNDSWEVNGAWSDIQYDECGVCGGDNSSCADCADVPNGLAYINPFCTENTDGCVNGISENIWIYDCLNIMMDTTDIASNSTETLFIYGENINKLQSLDIEFQYPEDIIVITDFSLDGTILDDNDYVIYDDCNLDDSNCHNLIVIFEPDDVGDEMFSTDTLANIFNIIIDTKDITQSGYTEIVIETLIINEHPMVATQNFSNPVIYFEYGCTNQDACNYNADATADDGSCLVDDCNGDCGGSAMEDCAGVCGGSAEKDECYVCGGDDNDGADNDQNGHLCDRVCEDGSVPDCSNVCGGNAVEDECGTCDNNSFNDCIQDCADNWVVNYEDAAFEDGCGQCIFDGSAEENCFKAEFKIFNSNVELADTIGFYPDSENNIDPIYVSLYMENFPVSFPGYEQNEGITLHIEYNDQNLEFIQGSLDSGDLNPSLAPGELDSENTDFTYNLTIPDTDSTGIIRATIDLDDDVPISYDGAGGNILFLEFKPKIQEIENELCGPGSATLEYNVILVNERDMANTDNSNIISNTIYFTWPFSTCLSILFHEMPNEYALFSNYPNPFNPTTSIRYKVPHYDNVTIEIINIRGHIIKTLVQQLHQPGNYEIVWDGANNKSQLVPSGIYFYRMYSSQFSSTKKLIMLK